MVAHLDGSLRQSLRPTDQSPLLVAAVAVVVIFCALPLASPISEAIAGRVGVLGMWAQPRPWLLLFRSLMVGGAVTACALAIGTTMGILIARCDLRARRLLWALHAFPFFLPPFLLALGWFQAFGRGAPFGTTLTSRVLFSDAGVISTLTIAFAPVATSLVVLALLGLDASLEEAARIVARPRDVVRRILLPTARPGLVLAGVVIFTLTVSEVGVPMFLRVDAFSAAVFSRLGGMSYAPGEAAALALPLILIAFASLAVERRFAGPNAISVGGLRAISRSPLPLGKWRSTWTVVTWAVVATGLVPLVALTYPAIAGGGLKELPRSLGGAPLASLAAALPAITLIGLTSVVLGHAIARGSRVGMTLDAVCMLAFLMPAPVLGAGLIAVWSGEATRTLYGSIGILVIGYVARYAVIGVRGATAVISQSPTRFEEAAAAVGATYWRRLTRIVLPANKRGMVAVVLLALIFCLRDLETAVLYYPPGLQPLPVRIFTLEANGPPSVVAALALSQILLTAVVCAVGLRWILGQRST